ncbi:MAG: hypothetical protein M5R41_04065 [Bacteroidia bacterium]|nr:hypothetical protein [Bacteroidia bacterium]
MQSTAKTTDGVTRFFLFLLALGTILWLGGTVYRAIIANEFFLPTTLVFDPGINVHQERMLFQLVAASTTIIVCAYLTVLVSAIVLLKRTTLTFKDNGWLLMASILFFMFVPAEIFTAWLDLHFIFDWLEARSAYLSSGSAAYEVFRTELRKTLSHRIGALHGLPVMAVLSYFTALAVLFIQPMRRDTSTREEKQ